ncbi:MULTISPECIES: CDP-alcohol phosphatidyltransferase family protein [unclassified Rathayibacter]|uniref:CDP-alcohol phosphatidyltransferase family protein n=1 Tax=unclassified Rathayibacter TaxID=2609250 RepID=UPI000CE86354|nr:MULTISPECIES: CDP-alcohol phosphatidyltransferase family protein [unclassified Rathayibacter]PPI21656.1 CDP-diacylglycerol--glycerol-3-phosphate 3-phosphatidyltransferase [Rathayibacter sp. AY1B6]PPI26710.1 CDP-diacylglycerol--glycerol-3-phosphate 3-phosphatidyltransferase [Rathayibacter sp. AY1B5]PPI39080.1 CDP-diacylglycerol--glycerol-3-phosphate 3-phosphatidyltransferase [Rathayibacter sp. AY1B1]
MARTGEDRIWTVPNVLSMVRLALVPVFLVLVVLGEDALALLTLVVSSLTDYLDGWIARRFDQMTRLGRVLDPAADRLYIFATVLGLAARGLVPWWLVAVLLARDLVLVVLAVVLANNGYGPLPVHHLGKFATFCLFYALPLIMLGQAFPALAPASLPIAWAFALWGAFLYWWAGIVYAVQTRDLVLGVRTGAQGSDEGHDSDTLT